MGQIANQMALDLFLKLKQQINDRKKEKNLNQAKSSHSAKKHVGE